MKSLTTTGAPKLSICLVKLHHIIENISLVTKYLLLVVSTSDFPQLTVQSSFDPLRNLKELVKLATSLRRQSCKLFISQTIK